jgi:hypothetical protein
MQAAGMAATMASSMVDDKEFVEKTSTYTPDSYSFQNAGLYNNAIGDIGQVDTYENTTEQTGLKKGLAGLGGALSVGSQFVGKGMFKSAADGGKPANSPVSNNFSGPDNIGQTA